MRDQEQIEEFIAKNPFAILASEHNVKIEVADFMKKITNIDKL